MVAIYSPALTPSLWPDRSDSTRLSTQRRIERVSTLLAAVDRTALTAPSDRLLFDNVSEAVDAAIRTRVCRNHLWAFTNAFAGWHVAASNAARVQSVGSDQARARALAVFTELPAAIRAERAMLQRGLDSGYTASRAVIAVVIQQIDDLLPDDITRSPLFAPATRDSTHAFRESWTTLLRDRVYPAGREFRRFLADEYAPRARAEGSLARMPDGGACYMATLRAQTSLDTDPDSVIRDARDEIDRVLSRAASLVKRLTGSDNTAQGIVQLRSDPRFTFPNRDSVLAAYREVTAVAATRFDRVVARFTAESLAVAPYPEFQERANLPPQYIRAPDDASRPAQFLVNLGRTERMSVANAVAHEAYPGHHLQRIAAVRAPAIHPVMRLIGVSGFSEGWGIYSEDLAAEMGLYGSALDTVGALVHMLDVAVANYLDIGFHTRGWSRSQLIDSMLVLGGRSQAQAEAYADRHAALPGQLAQYYIGYRAISDARRLAERSLGPEFRAADFNHEVIRDGSITLASLRAKVERWIAAQRTQHR